MSEGMLIPSYEKNIWPQIELILKNAIAEFSSINLPQRPSSPLFSLFSDVGVENGKIMYEDERNDALIEVGELMTHMSNAEDNELAAYILNQTIKIFKTEFEPLANILIRAQQAMEQKGLIPATTKTEFSTEYLSKMAGEYKRIIETLKKLKSGKDMLKSCLGAAGPAKRPDSVQNTSPCFPY